MRCSVFSVAVFLLIGCASDYKVLKQVPSDASCRDAWKPGGLSTAWYKASVDVVGRYISGLLLVKEMPDAGTRLVFTNEAGITYFDFTFDSLGRFTTNHVIRQLNKKPVITTLRKDFELWLGVPFRNATLNAWRDQDEVYYGVMQKKNTAFFVTDVNCTKLYRLERGSERKRTVTLALIGSSSGPDSVNFRHHTFDMSIALRKLERE